jgi:hypothetical protein
MYGSESQRRAAGIAVSSEMAPLTKMAIRSSAAVSRKPLMDWTLMYISGRRFGAFAFEKAPLCAIFCVAVALGTGAAVPL